MRPNQEGLRAAAAELVAAVPFVGSPIKAVLEFFEVRSDALRIQQLESWLQDLASRIDHLGADKLSRTWLNSEDGQRVWLAIGEAAADLLQEDKIHALAGAAVASAENDVPWSDQRRRFARIIIDSDLDILSALSILASDFGTKTERWNIRVPKYLEELPLRVQGLDLAPEILAGTDQYSIRDAALALERYRLADRTEAQGAVAVAPEIISVFPRPAWNAFAAYLQEALKIS